MLALNPTINAIANPASNRIPLLYTSRSPRLCSCLGRYLLCAKIEASIGNPLNAVFAARIKMAAVASWNARYTGEFAPQTPAPSWLITEGNPSG